MSKNFSKKNEGPEAEMPPSGTFFAPSGSRFGSNRCPGNGGVRKSYKGKRKSPLSGWKAVFLWLRGLDLNQRPPGYELPSVSPSAAAQCFPDLLGPEMAQNPKVVLLRSTAIFSDLGQSLGQPLWFPQQEVALALHHVWHMVHRRPILYFRTIPLSDRERM